MRRCSKPSGKLALTLLLIKTKGPGFPSALGKSANPSEFMSEAVFTLISKTSESNVGSVVKVSVSSNLEETSFQF
nr:hypothetical protein [Aquimarina aggregata]